MAVIYCRKCGEPWDCYGITYSRGEGNMTAADAVRFLKGEGCPSCHWGRHCIQCTGTCKKKDEISKCACHGNHYLIIHKLAGKAGPWQYDHGQNVCTFPGKPKIIFQYPDSESGDSKLHEALALCPYCADAACDCMVCSGTGKLQHLEASRLDAALWSLVEESDEDVTLYLNP